MNVVTIGPLPAGSLVWHRQGNRVMTVVCKATFALQPGESPLAPQQEPLHPADVHFEDDPTHSMQAPGDLIPFKARADVVLVGYAFAPRGEPSRHVVVRMIVGDMDKAFTVAGDQAWAQDGTLRQGQSFTRMPLRYERAGGGPDTANPIGVNPDAPSDSYGMARLPNLVPQGFVPQRRGEVVVPVGFGPLSASWPARRDKLGRLGPLPDRWDLAPLPADLEPAYFNCAPRDQQVELLRDNERIVLEHLHPQHPRLATNLPALKARAFADRGDGPKEIAMRADTLWIDTGRAICTLTWRGYVENPTTGAVVVATEAPGQPLPWAEVQAAARRPEAPRPTPPAPRTSPTLPFIGTRAGSNTATGLPFATGMFGAPSALRADPSPPSSGSGDTRQGGLPFARVARPDPLVSTASETSPPPGDAAPAWLQTRGAPPPAPPAPPPPVPSQVFPTPPAPPPILEGPPQSAPAAPSSPWASRNPSGVFIAPTAAPVAPPPPPPVVTPAPLISEPAAPAVAPALRTTGSFSVQGGSAAAASDAAAGASRKEAAARPAPAAPAPPAEKAARATMGEVLDLLWYDEAQVPRIRAWWEELVTELDFEASDPRRDVGAEDPDKARSRHNVFGVMSDGAVLDPSAVPRVIAEAVNEKGRFMPPLALVGGELRFPFDEVETLKATIVAMTPLVGGDKKLKESLDSMSELLKTPYLTGSTGVVPKLTRDLREQFREPSRGLPAGYLDSHIERLLLEQRRYSIRKVFGGELIRALLGAGDLAIPVYLPKHLDQTLPMVVALKARLIVEAHLQQDPFDTSPYALRAVALGRSFQLDALRAAPGERG